MADQTREFAFYYPNPYFHDADWVKNLILFFDGLALLIPEYMADHSDLEDLAIIQGLKEHVPNRQWIRTQLRNLLRH